MSDECRCGQPDCGWLPAWDEAMRRLTTYLDKCRHVGGTADCPALCLFMYGDRFVTERRNADSEPSTGAVSDFQAFGVVRGASEGDERG